MKSIAGTWYSERGSKIELTVGHDGVIEGTYHLPQEGENAVFNLVGMSDTRTCRGSRSFGFVVVWDNDFVNQHCVTAWSGQQQCVGGDEILISRWLLTKETAPGDDWSSTLVGSDTFRRTPVTACETVVVEDQHPEPAL